MLKFTELYLRNFLSHKGTSLPLSDRKGLILISGKNESGLYDSNGSGKSSILEGVVYALTGNTLRGLSVNDVVNRNVGKDTQVVLRFESQDSEYIIRRYRKDTENGDKIVVFSFKDDKDISKRLNKDTQSLIDNIVDIPYEVLVNTIFLGEGLSSKFTQLSDADKKSLIESTLNLSYDLGSSREKVSSKLKELKLERSNLEGRKSVIESFLGVDRENVEQEILALSEEISRLESSIVEMENEAGPLSQEISGASSKIDILKKSISEYELLEAKLKELDTNVAVLVQELTHIESSESPVCTLCKQALNSEDSLESLRSSYKSKIQDGLDQMQEWRRHQEALPPVRIMIDKVESLQRDMSVKTDRLNYLNNSLTESKVSLERYKVQLSNHRSLLENYMNYEEEYKSLSERILLTDTEISRYDYFYKLFSPTGLLTLILEEAISYINERIKAYTELLLDKSYQLSLNKGKLSLLDSSGSTYQSLSNGEKRRLDIAIQFSLHDYTQIYCGIGTNILFIDEILDTLDATGVNNIIEVLSLKKSYCNLDSIYVITHNNELKSYFDEVITVVKGNDGNSYIE